MICNKKITTILEFGNLSMYSLNLDVQFVDQIEGVIEKVKRVIEVGRKTEKNNIKKLSEVCKQQGLTLKNNN